MANIELFDRYINGELSGSERNKFKERLESDKEFATEYIVYLISVRGICQEAEQENIEFGQAMRTMTKAQLKSIIGKRERSRRVDLRSERCYYSISDKSLESCANEAQSCAKDVRPNFLRERMLWISSMAAMLIVAIGIGWNLYTISQHHLCDVVFNLAYEPIEGVRGDGIKYENLNNLTSEQIEDKIPYMKSAFEADEIDSQDWHIDGMNLAMAYLKLHRKGEAIMVLEIMADKASEPETYKLLIEQL